MSPSISVRLLATQSDARLVGLATQGHERAFEALVVRYRRALLGYCRRSLPAGQAEDALQQGLLQAWLALRSGTEVRDPKPWLYRIVHNAAVNAQRGAAQHSCELDEKLSDGDEPEADLSRRVAVRGVLAGLVELPPNQREALLRTAVQGDSYEQVGEELGLSDGAVRGLVYRARATLRAAATAITPVQLLNWALSSGARGAPTLGSLVELSASGGSIGLGGLLLKGGVVAITAGALVTGIGAGHPHRAVAPRHPDLARRVVNVRSGAPAGRTALPLISAAAPLPAARALRPHGLRSRSHGLGNGSGGHHNSATTTSASGQGDGRNRHGAGNHSGSPGSAASGGSNGTPNGSGNGGGNGSASSGATDGGGSNSRTAGSGAGATGSAGSHQGDSTATTNVIGRRTSSTSGFSSTAGSPGGSDGGGPGSSTSGGTQSDGGSGPGSGSLVSGAASDGTPSATAAPTTLSGGGDGGGGTSSAASSTGGDGGVTSTAPTSTAASSTGGDGGATSTAPSPTPGGGGS
jgi:RNA polymerase sigma factor (sigma-70 family)